MDSDSSTYYHTSYSVDEKIEKELTEERQQVEWAITQKEENRRKLFEHYANLGPKFLKLDGFQFHIVRSTKIKFSFRPAEVTQYVSQKVRFFVSLKYEKHWRIKRSNIPVNYRNKVYNLFYDTKSFIVHDDDVFEVVKNIYTILMHWVKEEQKFRLKKHQSYQNGEDVVLDSDDEELFLSQIEREELHRKREAVLTRMLPPRNLKLLYLQNVKFE